METTNHPNHHHVDSNHLNSDAEMPPSGTSSRLSIVLRPRPSKSSLTSSKSENNLYESNNNTTTTINTPAAAKTSRKRLKLSGNRRGSSRRSGNSTLPENDHKLLTKYAIKVLQRQKLLKDAFYQYVHKKHLENMQQIIDHGDYSVKVKEKLHNLLKINQTKEKSTWQVQVEEKHAQRTKVLMKAIKRRLKSSSSTTTTAAITTTMKSIAAPPVHRVVTMASRWKSIIMEVSRASKQLQSFANIRLGNAKKVAIMCSREARRQMARVNRRTAVTAGPITFTIAARRTSRDMLAFWRRNEREEREARKRAEKEAAEKQRQEEEAREARRQARKLNFLITQTELYGHFVDKKLSTQRVSSTGNKTTLLEPNVDFADVDEDTLNARAQSQAVQAALANQSKMHDFDKETAAFRGQVDQLDFKSVSETAELVSQPKLLSCQLKTYQLKGLSWLASLYEQGINGILADEMGLGKTVQAISLLAYLAETRSIWGPFLIITPSSTLHNWQQELARFVPDFRVLPYWGNVADRKTLRRFWDPKRLYTRDSHFHVLITSYQLVVADEKYFNRISWQYMILDEAQAIKSSSSARWNTLLSFKCRNRLLLTGTPIQNSMAELWALLHFVMPTLFDSHDEFSAWFARDIESHAEKSTGLDPHQLQRLHAVLRPFMIRRVKKDVENELGDKREVEIACTLSPRQRALYDILRTKIAIPTSDDLINKLIKSSSSTTTDLDSLMNLVMQLRKVCNHPDLFERKQVESPFVMSTLGSIDGPTSYITPLLNPLVYETRIKNNTFHICKDSPTTQLSGVKHIPELVLDSLENNTNHINDYSHPPIDICDNERFAFMAHLPPFYVPRAISYFKLAEKDCFANQKDIVTFPKNNLEELEINLNSNQRLIQKPDFSTFIQDSGKLYQLDTLLSRLFAEGHRCLVYSQMTRMIDLLEEYLQYRHYHYLRLDGSTRISDRRDLVSDWQTQNHLFVFLLSTRAGGLGINLTAADTVVFYDSDWNPTVDQQAMDRAHRLGQTRQVTVYRLITRGTIEERIMQRARQKDAIHRVVIAAGEFKGAEKEKQDVLFIDPMTTPAGGTTDSSKIDAKEIVSMLLQD